MKFCLEFCQYMEFCQMELSVDGTLLVDGLLSVDGILSTEVQPESSLGTFLGQHSIHFLLYP